jgi:hypothetical protein
MKPPKVKDPIIEKAFKELYAKVKELEKARGNSVSPTANTSGTPGATEVTKNADGTFTLRVRHGDGWVTFQAGADQFTK